MIPQLRFSEADLEKVASRYEYHISEKELIELRAIVLNRGYLKKEELGKIAYWKAPRSARHITNNPEEYVEEITGVALQAKTERARIEVLTILDGVSWPTASVILHFYHTDPYPIMDFRALWSVTLEVPKQYNFGFWWQYVQFCRKLAKKLQVDMRTLDRALWQHSKENQQIHLNKLTAGPQVNVIGS